MERDGRKPYYILEKKCGFQLCVHTRNFMAGALITTNIANAVNYSRKTIILLSQ